MPNTRVTVSKWWPCQTGSVCMSDIQTLRNAEPPHTERCFDPGHVFPSTLHVKRAKEAFKMIYLFIIAVLALLLPYTLIIKIKMVFNTMTNVCKCYRKIIIFPLVTMLAYTVSACIVSLMVPKYLSITNCVFCFKIYASYSFCL
jgi:hypothetical protein